MEIAGNDLWCDECAVDHIGESGKLEDRTYFAQFGKDCPYQVRA